MSTADLAILIQLRYYRHLSYSLIHLFLTLELKPRVELKKVKITEKDTAYLD